MPVGEYAKQNYLVRSVNRIDPDYDIYGLSNKVLRKTPLIKINKPTLLNNSLGLMRNNTESTIDDKSAERSSDSVQRPADILQTGLNTSRLANTGVGIVSSIPISTMHPQLGPATDVIGSVLSAADLVKMGIDKKTDRLNFDDAMRLTDDITGVVAGVTNLVAPPIGTALAVAEKVGTGIAKIIKAEIEAKPKTFVEGWNVGTDAIGIGWMNKDVKDAWKEDIKPELNKVKQGIEKVSDWGDMSQWKARSQAKKQERKKEKADYKAYKKDVWKHGSAKDKAKLFFFG